MAMIVWTVVTNTFHVELIQVTFRYYYTKQQTQQPEQESREAYNLITHA